MSDTPAARDSIFTRAPAAHDGAPVAEEELILGWECANPALQIERWPQEETAPKEDC